MRPMIPHATADPLTTTKSVTRDLEAALAAHFAPTREALDDLASNAYAERLMLENERLDLEREIIKLAARAEDTEAAQALRHMWLRRRTLTAQIAEIRRLLAEVVARYETQAPPRS